MLLCAHTCLILVLVMLLSHEQTALLRVQYESAPLTAPNLQRSFALCLSRGWKICFCLVELKKQLLHTEEALACFENTL